jgi:hypothetical protein
MAVQSATSQVQYVGNASTVTAYPVPFRFDDNSHIYVDVTTQSGVTTSLTETTDYVLTGAGEESGGEVVTVAAVPATSTVTIYRLVPITQLTSYEEGGDFPASSHERALDKLTQIAQQTERKASQSIRVLEADGERDPLAAIANSVLGLDSSKQPKAMTADELKTFLALTGVTLSVDAGMRTFADAGERALMVPQFTGQLGTQRDTNLVYISTGTSAGDWGLLTASLAMILAGTFTADATGRGKFANEFVNAALLASDAVTTAKILDLNVTAGKLAAALDLSGKTLTMPSALFASMAPAGAVLQVQYTSLRTLTEIPNATALNDNIPVITNGVSLCSKVITPSSASNKILVQYGVTMLGQGDPNQTTVFACRAGVTNALSCLYSDEANNQSIALTGAYLDSPASTSELTYSVRATSSGAAMWVNGFNSTTRQGGGVQDGAWILLSEIKG